MTRSPSLTASTSMRPPAIGDILARWQALTSPARVFETVASTLPRSTACTLTAIGAGRVNHHRVAARSAAGSR